MESSSPEKLNAASNLFVGKNKKWVEEQVRKFFVK